MLSPTTHKLPRNAEAFPEIYKNTLAPIVNHKNNDRHRHHPGKQSSISRPRNPQLETIDQQRIADNIYYIADKRNIHGVLRAVHHPE